jgi:hypothetical protein
LIHFVPLKISDGEGERGREGEREENLRILASDK